MKKSRKKEKIKLYILIGLSFAFIVLVVYNYSNIDNSYRKYKINRKENLVYTIYQKDKTYVPQINVKGMEAINRNIVDRANALLTNDKNVVSYDFDITAKVLSIAIQYIDMSGIDPDISYEVYNINFYTSEILNEEDILKLYDVDKKMISQVVEGRFKEFYVNLYQEKYFDEECDYDCFLYMRGIENTDYLKDSYYYIRNGNLYVLNPFKIYSPFREEKYFSLEDHYIQITE